MAESSPFETAELVQKISSGQESAIEQLVGRCYVRMAGRARSLIRRYGLERVLDAEGEANAALFEICRAAAHGKAPKFGESRGFWKYAKFLIMRSILHALDRDRTVKRGGPGRKDRKDRGATDREAPLVGRDSERMDVELDELHSPQPSSEELTLGAMEAEGLIEDLVDPLLMAIVRMRLEGYSIAEIAQATGQSRSRIKHGLEHISRSSPPHRRTRPGRRHQSA